jgi:pilus assembly protein CpaC
MATLTQDTIKRLLRSSIIGAIAITGFAAPHAMLMADQNEATSDSPSFVSLGLGKGITVRLPRPAKNVFIADPNIANVNPVSNQLVYVFGKKDGETTIYAVDNNDRVIYSATIRVSNNVQQLQDLLRVAMPNSSIEVQPLNGMVFLTGAVASPKEIEEAGRLAQQLIGQGQTVINRLQTKTPVQVHLQVKFAEVNRDTLKTVGVNWNAVDTTNGFNFGLFRGRQFINPSQIGIPNGTPFILPGENATALFFSAKALGLNLVTSVDALEQVGLLSMLAEPTLTALSGEKAEFLAGGEFPIAVPQPSGGGITVQFKEYGVKLAFTPTVHSGNRISLKVAPEVSQLTSSGAVTLNNLTIPALTTRKADTTVELGSGQSFVIAGLLQNSVTNDVNQLPGIGSLPIIGRLFKSDRFRRQETELVIVVTPYLVNPVNPRDIKLPTDGLETPGDLERYLLGRTFKPRIAPNDRTLNALPASANQASGGTPSNSNAGLQPGLQFGN